MMKDTHSVDNKRPDDYTTNKEDINVPTLSEFYGLVVRMFSERGSRHNMPHIHVVYQGEEYVFDFDGNELNELKMPTAKKKLLDAWMIIHREELERNWQMLKKGDGWFKIEPLH